jgi:predicted permease
VLVVAEVALSTTLLIAAGLLIRSLYQLQQERLGFAPEKLITFSTPFDRDRFRSPAERLTFTQEMLMHLERIPGVHNVAATNVLPLTGQYNLPTQRQGHPDRSIGAMEVRVVTPNYFDVMRVPLRRGRSFNPNDVATSIPVAVINDAVARTWWPGGDPLGDQLAIGVFQGKTFFADGPREIVGIVGDSKTVTLNDPPRPTVFIPMAQGADTPASLSWIVKADSSPALAERVRASISDVDPRQRVLPLRTMDEVVASATGTSRFNASLFAILASVALVLTVVGLYGVLSFLVAQRRQEIGIRMALGAGRVDILGLFMTQGITLTIGGLGLGLMAALLLTRWLSAFLYGVGPNDPASFVGVAILLLFVGLGACYLPARRATHVDPLIALRAE